MLSLVGNTPLIRVEEDITYFAKLEGANPFGSMKDRAAAFVIRRLYIDGIIDPNTEIVESSSGNFGVALAAVCKIFRLNFTCVIDPMIAPANKRLLEIYGAKMICANQCDENGSYLSNRLSIIREMLSCGNNIYWINQYNNPLMIKAYETTLAEELLTNVGKIDYVFVPVSTCGCIAGISIRLKAANPKIKVIAVDIQGSKIFEDSDIIRHIPGMGAPIQPENLQHALIDQVVVVSETECINECRKLVERGILVGASSGAAVAAIRGLNCRDNISGNIVAIFPDRGDRYADTIYNDCWLRENKIEVYTG